MMGYRGRVGFSLVSVLAVGCAKDGGAAAGDTVDSDPSAESTSVGPTPGTTSSGPASTTDADDGPATGPGPGSESSSEDEGGDGPPINLDVGGVSDFGGIPCAAPPQVNCDHLDDDPWHAFGVNCGGGPSVDGTITLSAPEQLYVHEGNLGTHVPAPFPPREGDKFVVLSSGAAADLIVPGLFASTGVGGPGGPLPPPMQAMNVSDTEDCAENPALLGTGDCSNTIEAQWDQGDGEAFDYAEMRFTAMVPVGTSGFTYDFAMFSTEYPDYYQSTFNDMYVAWLESELWTGNVSFDDMGHPISLNAGFLDYKDAPNDFDCPAPCTAPELSGTAMEGHAGTRWLTTTAPAASGEVIEVILAVFDLSDGILDTVVILDNFQWSCDGGPPVTIPG